MNFPFALAKGRLKELEAERADAEQALAELRGVVNGIAQRLCRFPITSMNRQWGEELRTAAAPDRKPHYRDYKQTGPPL